MGMDCDQDVAMKTATSVATADEFLTPKLYSPGTIESTDIATLHVTVVSVKTQIS